MEKTVYDLLTPFFCKQYGIEENYSYEIEWVDARELIVSDRLDLMPKLRWIKAYETGVGLEYAEYLYKESIKAITIRKCKEPGKENEKAQLEDFIRVFKELLCLKDTGFDSTKTVIPVGSNNAIMDGAHRTAIAAYYGLKVPIIRFPQLSANNGATFFLENLMDTDLVEAMISDYCTITRSNIYAVCIWPRGSEKNKRMTAEAIIKQHSKILYKKEEMLSYSALRNLIIQIYEGFNWLGGIHNHFPGGSEKANSCWRKNSSAIFYIIEGPSLDEIIEIKSQIRDVFQVGNHSIHITDNNSETISLIHLILNRNSLDLIKHGHPDRNVNLNVQIESFKDMIVKQGQDLEDYAISSDSVMGIYGLKKTKSIDYLSINKKNMDPSSMAQNYYDRTIDELICDPRCYLYFNGVKFLSIECVKTFKNNRKTNEDIHDVKTISSFLNDTRDIRLIISDFLFDASRRTKFWIRGMKSRIKRLKWVKNF